MSVHQLKLIFRLSSFAEEDNDLEANSDDYSDPNESQYDEDEATNTDVDEDASDEEENGEFRCFLMTEIAVKLQE